MSGEDLKLALESLRADPHARAWTERRELAKRLAAKLKAPQCDKDALALAHLLSEDPKWEVRGEIANLLPTLPERDQVALIAKLLQDGTSFVREAAERVVQLRRARQTESSRHKLRYARVSEELAKLKHEKGAGRAAKIAEKVARLVYDDMAGTISHELLSKLTSVKADLGRAVQCSRAKHVDHKQLEAHINRATGQLDFLERFLKAMKDFAKAMPDERTKEHIGDVLSEARARALEKVKLHGFDPSAVTASMDAPERLVAEVSRVSLVVALSDLIKNAFESFAVEGKALASGKIAIEARAKGRDRLEIVIRDTGMGMTPEDLAEVRQFTPGKRSQKLQGTGFGLPSARRAVLAHGGQLSIDSREHAGTTVTISLPLKGEVT